MSVGTAALLAALTGLFTGGITAVLNRRSGGESSVAATALAGAALATMAFGLFLILGFVVGFMMFSGPPDPTIALQVTLLMALVWLVLAAIRYFLR